MVYKDLSSIWVLQGPSVTLSVPQRIMPTYLFTRYHTPLHPYLPPSFIYYLHRERVILLVKSKFSSFLFPGDLWGDIIYPDWFL